MIIALLDAQQKEILTHEQAIVGLLSILLAALGWFLIREITRKDKQEKDIRAIETNTAAKMLEITTNFADELRDMADRNTTAVQALHGAISNLTLALAEQRLLMAEHYVSKPDFKESLEIVHSRITKQADRLAEVNERVADACPRGDCPMHGDPRGKQS